MALISLHYSASKTLRKNTAATVIVPDNIPGPLPVYYLLHGLSDDNLAWTRQTNVERYVSGKPLIIVMPNGERGWYTDAVGNPVSMFESLIVKELIPLIDSTFQTMATREGRAIGGLSMGGYGALKLAMKYPDMFRAAVSHAGAVAYAGNPRNGDPVWESERKLILGTDPVGGPNDLFAIAERADRATLPALHIDCGTEDFLLEDNREFDTHLTKLNIPHTYAEYPGNHEWGYWDAHVREALAFVCGEFGI